ncbi:MAG: hypothetical protein PUG48_00150 [Clostridia bacterium]|nr:hypothetical protein [Clostridia bacterium]
MKKIIFSNPLKHKIRINRNDIKNNAVFVVFCVLLFVGIITGAVGGRNADSELLKKLDFIFLTNFDVRCSRGVLSAFVSSFASSFLFLLVIFLLGLSVWGGIVVAVIPFFKGYGYGLSVGWLYCNYGFYGVLYNILVILPGVFLCSALIAAAADSAFKNSVKLMSCCSGSAPTDDIHINMKKYLISMLWFLVLAAVSAVADMIFSLCFSWIFNFS